jgi:hypothetical protein
LVLFAVKEDASSEDVTDLLSSLRNLRESIPNVMDLSVGEDFSGRAKGYTHGLFVRFRTTDDCGRTSSTPTTRPLSRSSTPLPRAA